MKGVFAIDQSGIRASSTTYPRSSCNSDTEYQYILPPPQTHMLRNRHMVEGPGIPCSLGLGWCLQSYHLILDNYKNQNYNSVLYSFAILNNQINSQ